MELLNNLEDQSDGKITSNEIRITIHQPRDFVFEYIMEPNNTPEWRRNISDESIDTEQIGLGTLYSNDFGESKVTDYERNVHFELSEVDTQHQCSYSFRNVNDIATEVIYFEGMLDGTELLEQMEVEYFEVLKDILER